MSLPTAILLSLLSLLTVILSVVGVQLFLVLLELRKTLRQVNSLTEEAKDRVDQLLRPLEQLGGIVQGMQAGGRLFEAFSEWLHKEERQLPAKGSDKK